MNLPITIPQIMKTSQKENQQTITRAQTPFAETDVKSENAYFCIKYTYNIYIPKKNL